MAELKIILFFLYITKRPATAGFLVFLYELRIKYEYTNL